MRPQPIGVDVTGVRTADRDGSRRTGAGHGGVLRTVFPKSSHRLDPDTVIEPIGPIGSIGPKDH
ncbi:hypothetical protein OOK36_43645 [Streptomyces sp. NBC_00365]|uniref:hypothetical protein n=1 Tax=Streptomyces sp. NBC_00365 TaxID=2975726 RepID=UPI00225215B7|nr:hypothetical protein [Streptomyces sp. NBC_00365]MCX5095618.1 hypothetical protein [Streptomyces sp. NBC_00365]